MYIYLIKYNGYVIAAAENEDKADEIIDQYIRNATAIDTRLFEKESIRYFEEERYDSYSEVWDKISTIINMAFDQPSKKKEYIKALECINNIVKDVRANGVKNKEA